MMSARDAVRQFNKYLLNPVMLRLAGRKYWYAAVIRHTGRRTGKEYATPVVADRVADGFLIPLPYGTDVDWLRNVRVSGHATVEADGRAYRVVDPAIVDAATAAPDLSPRHRRTFARFGTTHFLRVRLSDSD